MSENIADGYQFLMRTYEEGDKIFVCGFSRGGILAENIRSYWP
ncbi:MAG: phospholipase effector Tle1 domain-containing protein [Candidatus Kapaibacterium sp.]